MDFVDNKNCTLPWNGKGYHSNTGQSKRFLVEMEAEENMKETSRETIQQKAFTTLRVERFIGGFLAALMRRAVKSRSFSFETLFRLRDLSS